MPKRMQGPLQVGTVNCEQSRYDRLTQVSAFKEASLTSSDKKPLRAVLTPRYQDGELAGRAAEVFRRPRPLVEGVRELGGRACWEPRRSGEGIPHGRLRRSLRRWRCGPVSW